jgi:hypothetical protein
MPEAPARRGWGAAAFPAGAERRRWSCPASSRSRSFACWARGCGRRISIKPAPARLRWPHVLWSAGVRSRFVGPRHRRKRTKRERPPALHISPQLEKKTRAARNLGGRAARVSRRKA